MKTLIKKIINKFGYKISRVSKKFELINFDELLKEKIKKENPIIFDVGGNTGSSIKKFKQIFNKPIIHSFEPNKEVYKVMEKNYQNDSQVFCNNFALGNIIEEKNFNIMASSGKSSFYKINNNVDWTKNRKFATSIISTEKVKINTVDNYLKENKIDYIDFMKLDTQLYEDKILEGSLNSLKNNKIKIIVVEVIFNDYYEKYFTFSDIEKYLIPNKFRMVGIDLMNNNILKGSLFGADVYYFNKNYFEV
ncbi:MAG: hypothetical protein CBC25_07190 [Pelagibacteraceae bacterium TMED65]|nr:MAG: hypothetical protein CBC25_07190 [Pelagibacteraceae bacterium TMED65]|tara:strand:- start:2704 stop:3450 length:747 start_codon:yes stop_codon:yes gene_type:complete